MSNSRPKSCAEIAYESEIRVLKAVRLFGHLRLSEIARAGWPNATARVAAVSASRTVLRLLKNRELIKHPNNLGSMSILLAQRGANRLIDLGLEAAAGLEITSPTSTQFWHRTLGTNYLIAHMGPDSAALSEYALRQQWSVVPKEKLVAVYNKVPDGLVFVPGEPRGYLTQNTKAVDWIEVESADKSNAELVKIFELTKYAEQRLANIPGLSLDRVCLIYDAEAAHERRILAAVKKFLETHPEYEETLPHVLYLVRCYVRRPLIWLRHEAIPCAALLKDFRRTGRTELNPETDDTLGDQLGAGA